MPLAVSEQEFSSRLPHLGSYTCGFNAPPHTFTSSKLCLVKSDTGSFPKQTSAQGRETAPPPSPSSLERARPSGESRWPPGIESLRSRGKAKLRKPSPPSPPGGLFCRRFSLCLRSTPRRAGAGGPPAKRRGCLRTHFLWGCTPDPPGNIGTC